MRGVLAMLVLGLLACATARAEAFASAGEATVVRLRPGVRLAAGDAVTLARVAELAGPRASGLSVLDLDTQASDGVVSIAEVRALLLVTQALPPGEIELHGTACRVVRGPVIPAMSEPITPEPPSPDAGPTLEDQVRAHLAAMFGVGEDDLRIAFDERSAGLRTTPVAGRAVEIRATGRSARTPLAVAVFDGAALVAEGSVRADVTIRRTVLTLVAPVRRGQTIGPEHVRAAEAWLGSDQVPAPAEAVLGRVATRNLDAGAMLTGSDIERAIAVKRGDIVSVRSIVGAASVRTRARALAAAAEGDVIDLEVLGSKSRITARVLGPGRAVIAERTAPEAPESVAMEPRG